MADALSYELVSPERRLAAGEAQAIQLPGAEGDLTALPGHAPFLTSLRPGVVTVTEGGKETSFVVAGGFAEINAEAASVLAEEAIGRDEANAEWFEARLKDAEQEMEIADAQAKVLVAKRINDLHFLKAHLGL